MGSSEDAGSESKDVPARGFRRAGGGGSGVGLGVRDSRNHRAFEDRPRMIYSDVLIVRDVAPGFRFSPTVFVPVTRLAWYLTREGGTAPTVSQVYDAVSRPTPSGGYSTQDTFGPGT